MALVKYNNNSINNITSAASATGGAMTLIKTLTASSSSTLSFVDGSSDVVLDNTYPIYLFKIINAHPSSQAHFQVNFRDGGSSYDATKTTTVFNAHHNEADNNTDFSYSGSYDLAQSTNFQSLAESTGTGNDECCSGELFLFNPSSTTFIKNFISRVNNYYQGTYTMLWHIAGYCNTTTAIDGVQFKFASGNIDSGTIKLYGIKDS
tara:strand:- start:566 stop:1183 length:618 start_codon:yes stop_codon:yes gene_type:complete